jgi:hypothetical protein
MVRCSRPAVSALALLAGVSAGVWGCSGVFDTSPHATVGAAGAAGTAGYASSDDWWGVGWGGAAGASFGPSQQCEPSSEDDPDPDHFDANCDGIDGDVERAVFLSPLGDDAASGSLNEPVASMERALELARERDAYVLVCSATYEDNVLIEGAGARIFGGYACENGWARTDKPAEFAPLSGVPLTIREATSEVLLSALAFAARPGGLPGESSIAATVVGSSAVVMRHVSLSAGLGAHGSDGLPSAPFTAPAENGRAGKDAYQGSCLEPDVDCSGFCAPTVRSACKQIVEPWKCSSCDSVCETDGGKSIVVHRVRGGTGGNGYLASEAGSGLTASTQKSPKPGSEPGQGEAGAAGASGTQGFGTLGLDGVYLATNAGTDGRFGKLGVHGAGGKGGSAWLSGNGLDTRVMSGSGGSSGKPGCGGRPGMHGGGGGASIALISIHSTVSLERVVLRTAGGGPGGVPSDGTPGQLGGRGGLGGKNELGVRTASAGGDGGPGGHGGAGGPGGGGPSLGIVSIGSEPEQRAVTFDVAAGGKGARAVSGSEAADGGDGLSKDTHVIELTESE